MGEYSRRAEEADLPLVSFAALLKDSPARLEAAQSLLAAFKRDGFLYLTDFTDTVPQDLVEAVFAGSGEFFARPMEEKDALEWTGARANRGYTRQGREKTSQGLTREVVADERLINGEDLKESFEIGRDNEEGCPNQWPQDHRPETLVFKETMQRMFQCCKELHKSLMQGIALALSLDESFFDDYVRVGDNTLRLLHYPSVPEGGFEGGRRVRAGAHTDFGSLTLLFQDQQGGLQVERPGRTGWFNVVPREGTIVVNAGDLLARWSNDLIKSTMHQVVEPTDHHSRGANGLNSYPARYSLAYFCNPDFDRQIEVIPGTSKDGVSKYESVNSGDYLEQRLSATY